MSDLYNTTRLSTKIPGMPRVTVDSSVLEMATGRRLLNATMFISADDNGICTVVSVPLDPCIMRAMARVLNEHATRIAVELVPLLASARLDPEAGGLEHA